MNKALADAPDGHISLIAKAISATTEEEMIGICPAARTSYQPAKSIADRLLCRSKCDINLRVRSDSENRAIQARTSLNDASHICFQYLCQSMISTNSTRRF